MHNKCASLFGFLVLLLSIVMLLYSCVTWYQGYVYKTEIVSRSVRPAPVFAIVDTWLATKRAQATKYEAYETRVRNTIDYILDLEVRERIASLKDASYFLTHDVYIEVKKDKIEITVDPLGIYEFSNSTRKKLKEDIEMTLSTDVAQYENIDFFERKIYFDSAPRKIIPNMAAINYHTSALAEELISYINSRLRIY